MPLRSQRSSRVRGGLDENHIHVARRKVAIVTGSSRGIGRAIAERLADDGASVVVNYRENAEKARDVVAAVEKRGGRARAMEADMGDGGRVAQLFKATIEQFGRNVTVNSVAPGYTDTDMMPADPESENRLRSSRSSAGLASQAISPTWLRCSPVMKPAG